MMFIILQLVNTRTHRPYCTIDQNRWRESNPSLSSTHKPHHSHRSRTRHHLPRPAAFTSPSLKPFLPRLPRFSRSPLIHLLLSPLLPRSRNGRRGSEANPINPFPIVVATGIDFVPGDFVFLPCQRRLVWCEVPLRWQGGGGTDCFLRGLR